MAAIITPEVLAEIKAILDEHHGAVAAALFGEQAATAEEWEMAIRLGLVDINSPKVSDLQAFGASLARASASQRRAKQGQNLKALRRTVLANPIPRAQHERHASDFAARQGAHWVRGLGNRKSAETGAILIDADRDLDKRMRQDIRTVTAANRGNPQAQAQLAQRGLEQGLGDDYYDEAFRSTTQRMTSDLGHLTGDWSRDLKRIAMTEAHDAINHGVAEAYKEDEEKEAEEDDRAPRRILAYRLPRPDACFAPGTLITTARGQVPIERVAAGDFVLTHKLRWRRVTARHVSDFNGTLYGINGVRPCATGNHSFLVDMNWQRADSIKRGQQVVQLVKAFDANQQPPIGAQDSRFASIGAACWRPALMPASAVQLYRDLQRRNSDVDAEYPRRQLLESSGVPAVTQLVAQGRRLRRGMCQGALALDRFLTLGSGGYGLLPCASGQGGELLAALGRAERSLLAPDLLQWLQRVAGADQAVAHSVARNPRCRAHGGQSGSRSVVTLSEFVDGGLRHGVLLAAESRSVDTIASGKFQGVVYNLSVVEDESYFAEGFAVHNCKHCNRLYLSGGPGSAPRLYWLDVLEGNGSNVGRKAADWLAVISPTHPWCGCSLHRVPFMLLDELPTSWRAGMAAEDIIGPGGRLAA